MKKILILFIIILMTFSNVINAESDKSAGIIYDTGLNINAPDISALCAVAIDINTGKILYKKNFDKRTAPASTTKMMTAIVVVENCNLNDMVTVSKKAANTGGSSMGLYTGQKITVLDLLHGLLICSGNDAAIALAEHTAGDIPAFADLMNNKASQLALHDTHFVNPHGLDTDGHYTTAWDLAKIGAYALSHDTIRKIVGTKNTYVAGRNMFNTNELLGYYDGVYGLKTGFTNNAGRCLVTSAKKGDLDIVTVVLNCPTKRARTTSSIKILDYVFNTYEYYDLVNKGQIFANISVKKGIEPVIDIVARENFTMLLSKYSAAKLEYSVVYPEIVIAPVKKGMQVGRLQISEGGKLILNTPLVASEDIDIKDFKYYLNRFGESLLSIFD